jgi:excisionase family DNA binding protein
MKTGKEITGVKLYTVDEVAELLQINRLTVLKYIKQGRLTAARIGRPYMITEDGLREFLYNKVAEEIRLKTMQAKDNAEAAADRLR